MGSVWRGWRDEYSSRDFFNDHRCPMNRRNIKRVRDAIAAAPRAKFDMTSWFSSMRVAPAQMLHDCGTAGCIAGWAFALQNQKSKDTIDALTEDYAVDDFAGAWLGLDADTADQLFVPQRISLHAITRAHAVRALDHLLATGEVDWKSTRRVKKADTTEPLSRSGRT
jgi:hypothetical protein